MDLTDFFDTYPAPPRMQRGTTKRTMSVVFTDDEWRTIQKLANHEHVRALYAGHQSDLVRHGVYYMIASLEPFVEAGDLKHNVRQLLEHLRHDNLTGTKELIYQLLDSKADTFNDLLDFNEINGALDEYDQFLDQVAGLQPHWRRIIESLATEHQDMERFMQRIEGYGLVAVMALKEITEKVRA